MKDRLAIEFVCTGNGGRSPTAHTLAQNYVENLGLEERISIYSSGTGADFAEEDLFQFPIPFLLDYIEVGLRSGTYQGSAKTTAERVVARKEACALDIEKGDTEACRIVEYCIRYLMADEVVKRNQVLMEIDLVPGNRFHRQTKLRSEVDLILPMKRSNAEYVAKLYAAQNRKPQIVPLLEYAGMPGEVNDPFAGTIDDFRKTRDLIEEATKKSLDRAIGEYLR